MRISDWSSDVCSSDLSAGERLLGIVTGQQKDVLAGLDAVTEGPGSEPLSAAVAQGGFRVVGEGAAQARSPALGADLKAYRGAIQHGYRPVRISRCAGRRPATSAGGRPDRKSVVEGKGVDGRGDKGGG